MPYYNDPVPYPGIYRLKLPLAGSPLKYVNAYLLPSPSGHLLIDSGWHTEDTDIALREQLAQFGLRKEEIAHIVITHAHIDHYGMAAEVIRRSGARLSMHAIEEEMIGLRYGQALRFANDLNQLLRSGGLDERYVPDPRQMADRFARLVEFAVPDSVYRGGESIVHAGFEFQVLWTPGHSPGHVCLYDASRRLFISGDHVLPGITSHIGVAPRSGFNPLGEYIDSLIRLQTLDVDLVLPSHGPPVKGFYRRVKQILAHHRTRKSEIRRLLGARGGTANAFELATAMSWHAKGRAASWQSLRDFDQRLAITEVMAHLQALAAEGGVDRWEQDGVVTYGLNR